jgi:GH25 family lysozyme M1 (1,4-beta-N-acetylmuramidase)
MANEIVSETGQDEVTPDSAGDENTGTTAEAGGAPQDAVSEAAASDSNPPPQDVATNADAGSEPLGQAVLPEDGVSNDPASDTGTSQQDAAPGDAPASPNAGADQDPGQPYLFVDLYSLDDNALVGERPDWNTLANTKGYFGAILKAWDGKSFNDGGWFQKHWPAVRGAVPDRYGNSWFRGAYLFLEFSQSGAEQADAYLSAVDAAGGWGAGDILPIIDAEQGREARPAANGKPAVPAHPNRSASKQQVVDCVTECANRIRDRTGRRVILYGRGVMRDLGINDRMGCDLVWNPAYTPTMVLHGLEAWDLEDVVLWQYCGDGTAAVANLPRSIPNFGTCDISVFVKGAQRPTLQLLRENLLA